MKARAITALLLIPIVLWAIYSGGLIFNLLMAFVVSVSAFESARIARLCGATISMPLCLTVALSFLFLPDQLALGILMLGVAISSALVINRDSNSAALSGLSTAYIIFYSAVPMKFVIYLEALQGGWKLVLLPVISLWAADSFAYFGGVKFGKSSFCPAISPNKSWEGFWAGLLGSVIIAGVYGHFQCISLYFAIMAGIISGTLGPLGDLFESSFKRMAQIKDSSSLFPGHGGMLDRMDSFTFVLPSLYLLARFFMLEGFFLIAI